MSLRGRYPPSGDGPPGEDHDQDRGRRRGGGVRGSPSPPRGKDDWNRSTEAFLSNLGAPTHPATATHGQGSYATAYPSAYGGGYSGYGAQQFGQGVPGSSAVTYPGLDQHHQSAPAGRDGRNRGDQLQESRPRRSPSAEERSASRSKKREKSSDSEEEDNSEGKRGGGDRKRTGITVEQREKFKEQRGQYLEANEKLEAQLMKLKEQREDLKERGAKHEDDIMKENARLQKEVKLRINQMVEVLDKLDLALKQPTRSPSPSPSAPKRKAAALSKVESKNSAEPEKKAEGGGKKSKKKKKSKSKSSSEDESEDRARDSKKKKRRKKRRKKASSSSSSTSSTESSSEEEERRKKSKKKATDADPMLELTKGKKGSGDDALMDLLAKMSEAYMKSKQENAELAKRIDVLEGENLSLKKKLQEMELMVQEGQKVVEKREESSKKRSKWDQMAPGATDDSKKSQILEGVQMLLSQTAESLRKQPEKHAKEEQAEHREMRNIKRLPTPPPPPECRPSREQQVELNAGMEEVNKHELQRPQEEYGTGRIEESKQQEPPRGQNEDSRRRDRDDERRGFQPQVRRRHDSREDYRREDFRGRGGRGGRDRRSRSKSRDRDRRSRERRSRSRDRRSRSRGRKWSRSRSRSRERDRRIRDRYDRVKLDEWTQRPTEPQADPELLALRRKMREREEERERLKEENRKKWGQLKDEKVKRSISPSPGPKETGPPPLPSARPQVAIQWGQGTKKVGSDVSAAARKAPPVIGKMPGSGKRGKTPDKPERGFEAHPPPQIHQEPPKPQPQPAYQYGITPEMYMQAITATMPAEPPPGSDRGGMMGGMNLQAPPPHVAAPPPKHPNPGNMDLNAIMAAAREHMQKNVVTAPEPARPLAEGPAPGTSDYAVAAVPMDSDVDIPLPPLPAAQDKDPDALLDTRPPKLPTPPPQKEKSEMELMIEKHCDSQPKAVSNEAETQKTDPFGSNRQEMDPEELQMLGIDPSDLKGFG